MRASRAQYLQTRFDTHVDLGCMFFAKARNQRVPYAWMARMQFDKAARHSPERADEIARFYADRGRPDLAVVFFTKRLQDPSCSHDPTAYRQLGDALQTQAQGLTPPDPRRDRLQTQARAAIDRADLLSRPAPRDAL